MANASIPVRDRVGRVNANWVRVQNDRAMVAENAMTVADSIDHLDSGWSLPFLGSLAVFPPFSGLSSNNVLAPSSHWVIVCVGRPEVNLEDWIQCVL